MAYCNSVTVILLLKSEACNFIIALKINILNGTWYLVEEASAVFSFLCMGYKYFKLGTGINRFPMKTRTVYQLCHAFCQSDLTPASLNLLNCMEPNKRF